MSAEISDDVVAILLDRIDASGRLRPVDPDWAAALADSFEERGQDVAIEVRPDGDAYKLTCGAHRLAAAALLGWSTIRAIVVPRSDDEARLVEIEENLLRSDLVEIDRARFLYDRKLLRERMYPETRHGAAPKGKNKIANLATRPRRFTAEAAEKFGLGERTVQRACQIAEALGPDMLARLRGTSLADNQSQLAALARLSEQERETVVSAILNDGEAFSGALRAAGLKPEEDADEAVYRALVGAWSRASNKVKRRFQAHIGKA